jgi:hypothetical protein
MSEIVKHEGQPLSVFSNPSSFDHAQRIAKMLCSSDLVPAEYRGNMSNTLVALEMANRVGASPLAVMQNMYVIEGRPSWSSAFIIAALNSCGRFAPLRFKVEDLGEREVTVEVWEGPKGQRTKKLVKQVIHDKRCVAYTKDKSGEHLEGGEVTIGMAIAEGWFNKPGSKWKTMPDTMLRYRAAAFFGRLYAPDVLMGMHTAEEVQDTFGNDYVNAPSQASAPSPVEALNSKVKSKRKEEPESPKEVIIQAEAVTVDEPGPSSLEDEDLI